MFENSEQKQYESAMIQYKIIDVKNSFEDLMALARVFYKLGKYQQCSKSKWSISNEISFGFGLMSCIFC